MQTSRQARLLTALLARRVTNSEAFRCHLPGPGWRVLGLALSSLIVGRMGAELFLARFSRLLLHRGLIVLFLGWNLFPALLFPWAFLILMTPLPTIVFNQITFPLQLLTSKVAAEVRSSVGVSILSEGNVMYRSAGSLWTSPQRAAAFTGFI